MLKIHSVPWHSRFCFFSWIKVWRSVPVWHRWRCPRCRKWRRAADGCSAGWGLPEGRKHAEGTGRLRAGNAITRAEESQGFAAGNTYPEIGKITTRKEAPQHLLNDHKRVLTKRATIPAWFQSAFCQTWLLIMREWMCRIEICENR